MKIKLNSLNKKVKSPSEIYYDFFESPFGNFLLSCTEIGMITALYFGENKDKLKSELIKELNLNKITKGNYKLTEIASEIFPISNNIKQYEILLKRNRFSN